MELAKYYEVEVAQKSDLDLLYSKLEGSPNHTLAFDVSLYLAAWIKSEVGKSKLVFAKFDSQVLDCIRRHERLQSMLFELAQDIIGFELYKLTID